MTKTSNPFAAMLATEILADPHGSVRVLNHYLKDDSWGISQKVDGRRMLILTDRQDFKAMNRKGEVIDPKLTPELQESLSRLGPGYLLDGEFLEDRYILFDLVQSPEELGITPSSAYIDRYKVLKSLVEIWEPQDIEVLPFTWISEEIEEEENTDPFSWDLPKPKKVPSDCQRLKKNRFDILKGNDAEGAIFRSIHGMYKFGVSSPTLLKYKFWHTVDCIVFNPGRDDKLSVGVAVMEDGEPVDIGAVTVTESMLESIHPGQVLECRYLYATESRRLFQTTLLRVRDDKDPAECDISQLHYTNKKVISDDNTVSA